MNIRHTLSLLLVALLVPACAELDDAPSTLHTDVEALRAAPSFSAYTPALPRTAGAALNQLIEQGERIALSDVQPVLREDAEVAFALRFADGGVLGVNVLLDDFGLDTVAASRALTIDPSSIDDFAMANALDGWDELTRDQATRTLNLDAETGRSFCDNEDGTRGHTVIASATATLDGVRGTVLLQLNPYMDAEQLGLDARAPLQGFRAEGASYAMFPNPRRPSSRPEKPSVSDRPEERDTEWVVSWPSSDCKFTRDERRRRRVCLPDDCRVNIDSALLRLIARQFGLDINIDLDLLPDATGYCGEVFFLDLFSVGCQCVITGIDWGGEDTQPLPDDGPRPEPRPSEAPDADDGSAR